jgi:hypothetical protein
VDTPIKLHNQTSLGAAKINDVATHGVLAAELGAAESESPQQALSDLFGFGSMAAKLTRPGSLLFVPRGGATFAIR